jgi:hypothetical protein
VLDLWRREIIARGNKDVGVLVSLHVSSILHSLLHVQSSLFNLQSSQSTTHPIQWETREGQRRKDEKEETRTYQTSDEQDHKPTWKSINPIHHDSIP